MVVVAAAATTPLQTRSRLRSRDTGTTLHPRDHRRRSKAGEHLQDLLPLRVGSTDITAIRRRRRDSTEATSL